MKRTIGFILVLALMGCKDKKQDKEMETGPMDATISDAQAPTENEWTVLFDGSSFEGWHIYNGGEVGEPWTLEDGAMVFNPPADRPEGTSYNLVTDKEYTNFVLQLEWNIAQGGNSGIFWGVQENDSLGQPYLTGPEIQVLDDERHPDAKNGPTRMAGALYDMVPPSEKAVKPAGEWNQMELMINQDANQGHVILNGKKIVEFAVHGTAWEEMVSKSKFADWKGFGAFDTGKLGVQDHGDRVSFRNIKVKEL